MAPELRDERLESRAAPPTLVTAVAGRPRAPLLDPDPARTRRVLITDGHTRQALACARSLGRAGYDVFVSSHYRRPLAAWSRYCGASFSLVGQTTDAYAELRSWARERNVGIVLPITEAACFLCNADREAWQAAGITLGCGPDPMLLQAFDKGRTLDLAVRCGLAVPETRTPTTLEGYRVAAAELGFPCVIKPRFSNLRQGRSILPDHGVAYVNEAAALEAAVMPRRQMEHWPLIQRYVPGTGKGVFALCDHGRPIAWFAHQRLRDIRPSGSGSSLRRSAPLDPRLRSASEKLIRAMQWHGPAMIEFRDDGSHTPWLMEVNGRFWGSLQLAIAAGVDFPLLWVRTLQGEAVEQTDGYRLGVTVRWMLGDLKRLAYILRGRPPGFRGAYPSVWQGLCEVLGTQPDGTRPETWDRSDPWPAVGQWTQGVHELIEWRRQLHNGNSAGTHEPHQPRF